MLSTLARQRRLIFDSLLLGTVGALSAQLFTALLHVCQFFFLQTIAGYTPPGLPDEGGVLRQVVGPHGLWLIPIATTLGGLISGWLVFRFAPEAEGHGTDTAVKAFHHDAGFIRLRVPPLKMLASALTIGSGGSAGREGPTALISAGFGSAYANVLKRSESERRILVLAGMAAGLSAMFRSPIGTALFAVEVLYSDMEFEVAGLLFTMLSAITAYAVNGVFVSWKPLFQLPESHALAGRADYGWYLVLGIASGLVAAILPTIFYGMRDFFLKLKFPIVLKPALGGFLVGCIALVLPQVLGGGYGWVQQAMNGNLGPWLLLAMGLGKVIAFSLTVSSGGSGGVFAPSLYIGGMIGALIATLAHQPVGAFAVVGMAALFGGAARVPIATVLMVAEMTGGFGLLVPAAFSVIISFLVQTTLTEKWKYRSLYEAQVSGRGESPAHEAEHLGIALKLLERKNVTLPMNLAHLDLVAMLRSGIRLDLPDGKRLCLETVTEENKTKFQDYRNATSSEEVIGVLRHAHLLLPHPQLSPKPEDKVLLLSDPPSGSPDNPL